MRKHIRHIKWFKALRLQSTWIFIDRNACLDRILNARMEIKMLRMRPDILPF